VRGNCHQNKNLRIVSILFDFLNFNLVKSLYCTVLYCTALYQTELHCILPAIVECQLNLPLFFLSHCKNNVLLLILLCQCQCLNFWQYILFESTPILTYLVILGRMTIISVSDIAFSEILSTFKSIPQTQYPDLQKHVLKSHQIVASSRTGRKRWQSLDSTKQGGAVIHLNIHFWSLVVYNIFFKVFEKSK